MCRDPVVFMYSGQGSQYFDMGRQLYEENRTFRYYMDYCGRIVRDILGCSLLEIVYSPSRTLQRFDRLVFTHPALVAIQYSLTEVFRERGYRPDYLLGYSLGEFVASVVAGVLSIEDALGLVIAKAKALEANAREASMMAVLARINAVSEMAGFRNIWVACENYSSHFVVAGLDEDVLVLKEALSERNVITQLLPIRYGFHSPLMDETAEHIRRVIESVSTRVREPAIELISCETTDVVRRPDASHMWNVYRNPVLFEQTVKRMHARFPDALYIDMGPAGTLAGFVRMITGENKLSIAVMTPFGRNITSLENCMAVLENKPVSVNSLLRQ